MLGDIEGFWGADVWSELQDPITDTSASTQAQPAV